MPVRFWRKNGKSPHPNHHHEHHQHHCHHHHQHHHHRRHHHRQCHRCRPLAKLTLGWIIARPWTLRNTLHTTAVAQKYKWKSDRNTRWALLRNTLQSTTVDQKKGRTACRIHWLALNRNTAAPKYSFTRKSLTDTNYEIQHQFPMTAYALNSYDLRLQQIIFGHFATSAGRLFLLLFILHWICQYLYIHVFLCMFVFCICVFVILQLLLVDSPCCDVLLFILHWIRQSSKSHYYPSSISTML